MFNIQISDSVKNTFIEEGKETVKGKIIIGDFSETIFLSLEYWSLDEYRSQWVDAIDRLVNGDSDRSALITEMYNPSHPRYALMAWPLYKENHKVYVQNEYIPYDQVESPFTLDNFYKTILDRDPTEKFSEWEVTIDDLKEFLRSLKTTAGA